MTGTVQPAVSPPLFGGPVTPFLAAILGPPSELHIAALQHISVDAVSAAECAGSPSERDASQKGYVRGSAGT